MSALAVLKHARNLLAKGWTQGAYARGTSMEQVGGYSTEATCFCIVGAVARAEHDLQDFNNRALGQLYVVIKKRTGKSAMEWNDTPGRTHQEVLDMMDEVIREEEARSDS